MFVDTQKKDLAKASYPLRVVELWCRHTRAYNDFRGAFISDLINYPSCGGHDGGFNWGGTEEGHYAWRDALLHQDYHSLNAHHPHLYDEFYIDLQRFD